MAEQETDTKEQADNLDSERESLIAQMKALDEGESPVPAQASATPEAGERTPATDEKPAPEQEQQAEPEAQQETDRKAKEAERLEKTWANANRRKAELEAKEKALAAREADIERLREDAAQKASTAGQFTPEDFEVAAKRFEEDGDTDSAKLALGRAKELRAEVEAVKAKQSRAQFESDMRKAITQAKSEHPELDDPESPLAKTVAEVIANRPVFKSYPQGVMDAVRVAELKMQADAAADVQKERDELKARLAEVEKKLQPGGSTPGQTEPEEKPWDKLSLDEQGKRLLQLAGEADASGLGAAAIRTQ